MPIHHVSMTQPKEQLVHADVRFTIQKDGEKLGELHISKGNVEWWPKGNKRNKLRLSWTKFAEIFEESGKPIRQR